MFHAIAQSRTNDVFHSQDVCMNAFERIVFGQRNDFLRCGVDDIFDIRHRHGQPFHIPHIAEKEPHGRVLLPRIQPLHLFMLHFVPRQDHDPIGCITFKQRTDENFAKGTCPPRNEDRRSVEIDLGVVKRVAHDCQFIGLCEAQRAECEQARAAARSRVKSVRMEEVDCGMLCLPFISSGVHQERRPVRRHW